MRATRQRVRTARLAAFFFRSLVAVVVALVALCVTKRAEAYPWMIRHDYATCATCHADPSGAGILTAYGRAQSEVLVRTHYGPPAEDEDPAKKGSFAFGAINLPEALQLQADVRTLFLHHSVLGTQAPDVNRIIIMQADAAASISAGPFRAAGTLGYVHEGALAASVTRGDADRLISRQHWLGVAFGKDDAFLLRAGRMNLPFGLRMIEHELLTRRATRTDINAAQQHGVALAWNVEGWRAEIMAIAGNFQLRPDVLRDRGGTAYVEHAFSQKLALGLSSMITHAEQDLEEGRATFRQAHGIFGRWSPAKPIVIMAEADILGRSPKRKPIRVGGTSFVQVDVEPLQGLHFAATGEVLTTEFGTPAQLGGWLSAFWFFLPRLDVRTDLVLNNVPVGDQQSQNVLSYLVQLHGFL